MWQRIDVGATRVAVVHGDAESLAGWGFAQEVLREASHLAQVRHWFAQAQVDVFASSHTCLPIYQRLDVHGHAKIIANNGAVGLPNFAGTQYGVLTRIATRPYECPLRCGDVHAGGVYIDALALHYAQTAWHSAFSRNGLRVATPIRPTGRASSMGPRIQWTRLSPRRSEERVVRAMACCVSHTPDKPGASRRTRQAGYDPVCECMLLLVGDTRTKGEQCCKNHCGSATKASGWR